MTDSFIETTLQDFRLWRKVTRLSQFGFLWHKPEILWANGLLPTQQELHTSLWSLSYQDAIKQFWFFASGRVTFRKFCQFLLKMIWGPNDSCFNVSVSKFDISFTDFTVTTFWGVYLLNYRKKTFFTWLKKAPLKQICTVVSTTSLFSLTQYYSMVIHCMNSFPSRLVLNAPNIHYWYLYSHTNTKQYISSKYSGQLCRIHTCPTKIQI